MQRKSQTPAGATAAVSWTERCLNIASATFTLTNAAFALQLFAQPATPDFAATMAVESRIVLFIILECSPAHAFGFLLKQSAGLEEAWVFVLFIVIAFCSAWVSLFNVQYICFDGDTVPLSIGFFFALCFAAVLAILMIRIHLKDFEGNGSTNLGIRLQLGAFAVLYLAVISAA